MYSHRKLFLFLMLSSTLVSSAFADSSSNGANNGKGTGKGNPAGHTHANLQSQIDDIELMPGPQGPPGVDGATGPVGPTANCTAVMTQMSYDSSLLFNTVWVQSEETSTNASHDVKNCPLPYTRTGASCMATTLGTGNYLRQSGTTVGGSLQIYCRAVAGAFHTPGSFDFELGNIRLTSYPICMKVELVCESQ